MSKFKVVVSLSAWLMPIVFGFHVLLAHAAQPGVVNRHNDWPQGSHISPAASSPFTVVMFVHPQCPCTAASISELSQLMSHCWQVRAYVLFVRPAGFRKDWEKSNLWSRVAAIPGAIPLTDINGREGKIFAATTSGETLLYDREGKLLFAGGITGSRGHEGDNQELSTIEAVVSKKVLTAYKHTTNVFGCALQSKDVTAQGELP